MSWADDEWKDGLPYRALQKIQQLEGNLEKLQKDQKQKQFQLDSIEAAYQKQLKKVECNLSSLNNKSGAYRNIECYQMSVKREVGRECHIKMAL